MVTYRVRLDVPGELVLFVARLLARHRKQIGTRKNTRCLGCYRQALFALAWYRDKADIPRLGAGFGRSQATSYRYLDEVTEVVAAEAPGLEEELVRAVEEGAPYVILSGNVSLENNQSGWTGAYNANSVLYRMEPAGGSYDGLWALQVALRSGTSGVAGVTNANPLWVPGPPGAATTAGQLYTGSAFIKANTAGEKISLTVKEQTTSGTVVSSHGTLLP